MAQVQLPVIQRGFGETMRTDVWWFRPLAVFVSLATFLVYATWAAWQGDHYIYGPYISPFYSPELFGHSQHTLFGPQPAWWPSGIVFSPALLILPFPGLFRLTCYYYRGAYYRAFWADPPACAVGEPRKTYWGESRFPLLLQNVHRYFMYVALLFLVFLAADVYQALWFPDPATGKESFGIGVGTLVLAGNVVLLSGYTPEYAYERGRLDRSLPFEELQRRSLVNAAGKAADQAPDFSRRIRAGLPGAASR